MVDCMFFANQQDVLKKKTLLKNLFGATFFESVPEIKSLNVKRTKIIINVEVAIVPTKEMILTGRNANSYSNFFENHI